MSYLAALNLSVSDLILEPAFPKAWGEKNKKVIDKILFEWGMDPVKGYEEFFCEHRNRQNQVVKCILIQGFERTDKSFLQSGNASIYAKIEGSDHCPHMKGELLGMLHSGGSADLAWSESLQKECK